MTVNASKEHFTVDFDRRDFSGPVLPGLSIKPVELAWSIFGGPARAELTGAGSAEKLMDLIGLVTLRRYGPGLRSGTGLVGVCRIG